MVRGLETGRFLARYDRAWLTVFNNRALCGRRDTQRGVWLEREDRNVAVAVRLLIWTTARRSGIPWAAPGAL